LAGSFYDQNRGLDRDRRLWIYCRPPGSPNVTFWIVSWSYWDITIYLKVLKSGPSEINEYRGTQLSN